MAVRGPFNAFSFDISLVKIGQEIKLLEHFKNFLDHLYNNKFIIAFIFNTIVPSKEVIWYGSQAVSKNEEGVYNCVSRGVADDDVNIRSVRMVVQGDWEEVYETDPYVSFWQESRFSQRSAKTSCLAR
jgi:hypothetical protein